MAAGRRLRGHHSRLSHWRRWLPGSQRWGQQRAGARRVPAVVGVLQCTGHLLWWLCSLSPVFLKELLGDSGKLLVLHVCWRPNLGLVEEWELWCDQTGHWVVASYVCVTPPLNSCLYNLSGSLRGTEENNLNGGWGRWGGVGNDLHFFQLQLKFVYWLNSQTSNRSPGPRAQAAGKAVLSLVESSSDTFGLALLPDDRDEMSWLPDWFLSREQHTLPNSRTGYWL